MKRKNDLGLVDHNYALMENDFYEFNDQLVLGIIYGNHAARKRSRKIISNLEYHLKELKKSLRESNFTDEPLEAYIDQVEKEQCSGCSCDGVGCVPT